MYQYRSWFAEDIKGMLAFKERLGYSKSTHEPSLRNFDAFCLTRFPNERHFSEEIVLAWLEKRPQEFEGGLKKRANTMRQFGLYLAYMGKEAYILPSDFVGGRSSFIPYIFSDEELTSFFRAADQYAVGRFALCRHYTVSVIFRLIYCCGLRPNEGRLLKTTDINLSNGRLTIRETKQNKERQIIMADDVCEMCYRYDALVRNYVPEREFFFSSMNGSAYAPNTLIHFFRQCWAAAGGSLSAERTPRIYDLRHRFATTSLMQSLNAGKDIQSFLPYLSAYMGHAQLSDTAYYIHLLPDHLTRSSQIDWERFSNLIPEVWA